MTAIPATIQHPGAAALAYTRRGWPVFPCRPGAKVPLTAHGVSDATTDEGVVARWWARWPTANVAIATGKPAPDVVDVDVKGPGNGPASCTRLTEAGLLRGAMAVVTTPSGGWHIYYAGTEQGNGSMPRHGIDFRSRGGYVLGPPSVVDGRPYVLTEHRPATGVEVDFAAIRDHLEPSLSPRPAFSWKSRGDFDALIRHVAGQQEGNRNNALHWAACRAVEGGADEAIFQALIAAAVSTGHALGEARKTVASARRTAVMA